MYVKHTVLSIYCIEPFQKIVICFFFLLYSIAIQGAMNSLWGEDNYWIFNYLYLSLLVTTGNLTVVDKCNHGNYLKNDFFYKELARANPLAVPSLRHHHSLGI